MGKDSERLDRAKFASMGTAILIFFPTDSGLKPGDTRPHHSLPEARGLCLGKEFCPSPLCIYSPSIYSTGGTLGKSSLQKCFIWYLKLEFVATI